MIKNYFKIAWRNLHKNKAYSAINIGGLALGMAVTLIIALWVNDELTYNNYFKNHAQICPFFDFKEAGGNINTGLFRTRLYLGNRLVTEQQQG